MILVAGSGNLDFVVRASHVPAPGETVLGSDLRFFPGGKGANQAVACARAGGVATDIAFATGDDWLANAIEESLTEADIGVYRSCLPNERTGTAFICLSEDGQNAITVAPGANNQLSAADLPELSPYEYLMMQLEVPTSTVTECARIAKERGVKVVLNAAPARTLPADLLELVDILIVNEGELFRLSGERGSLSERMQRLRVPLVVVTLGHRGCCAVVDGVQIVQAGFPVDCVDTTAAGDAFCGALIAALCKGSGTAESLRTANAAGALACTRLGAQASIPCAAEVIALSQARDLPGEDQTRGLAAYCNSTIQAG